MTQQIDRRTFVNNLAVGAAAIATGTEGDQSCRQKGGSNSLFYRSMHFGLLLL